MSFHGYRGHGIWLAARAEAGAIDVAHTTPVYVTIAGDGFHDHDRLHFDARIAEVKLFLQEIRAELTAPSGDALRRAARSGPGPWAYAGSPDRLERRIGAVERRLDELAARK